jgi:hypothetical protein
MKQFMEMEKDLIEDNKSMSEKIRLVKLEEMIIGFKLFFKFLACVSLLFFHWIIFNLSCSVKICVFVFVIHGAMEQWKFALLNLNHNM